MSESDYINATNLTKLRIAYDCIHDAFPDGPIKSDDISVLLHTLRSMINRLEKIVGTE